MKPELPAPHAPEESKHNVCNNPIWYEIFATSEERQAWLMNQEQQRIENNYKRLMEDLDLIQDENFNS